VQVDLLQPLDGKAADEALASFPEHTFFHCSAWAKALCGAYGCRPYYLGLRDAGRIRALLPVMEAGSWLTGRRGVSLPFTDFCEPLTTSTEDFPALLEAAHGLGRRRRWTGLELRGGRRFLNGRTVALSYYGHELDLSSDTDAVFKRFDGSVRRAIRKAQGSDVTVTLDTALPALQAFYRLNCLTRREHGLPPQPFVFFRGLHEHVLSRGLGFISLAWHHGRAIAAAVFFHLGCHAIFKYGASEAAFQHLRGNNLAMWQGIERLARQGVRRLSLGRTDIAHDGLRRFKLGWGARESSIEYFKYDFRKAAYVADRSRLAGWHNALFRALPIPVARLAGAALYRHAA
jgi:hypothetical protein